MEDKGNKKTAALNALQKIRERVKPDRGLVQMFFPDVPAEKVRRYFE